MHYTTVELLDSQPCKVLRLSVFGLDGVGPDIPGPFRYQYKIGAGGEHEQLVDDVYDTSARSTPPRHPGIPRDQIVQESPEWWQMLEFETYKAAVAYEVIARLPASIELVRAISAFIASYCLHPDDRDRVFSDEDWIRIYRAAVVPAVTQGLIAQAFKDNFSASYETKEIFDAIDRLSEGKGKTDVLRQWEFDAMAKFGFKTEEEWANLELPERVRKTASIALPKLMESLASHDALEEAKRKR